MCLESHITAINVTFKFSGTHDQQNRRRSDALVRRIPSLQHHGRDVERNFRAFREYSVNSTYD